MDRSMKKSRKKSRLLAACALVAVGMSLSACGPRVYNGGHHILAEDLARIQPGEVSISQVQRILGSPSTKSLYGQETWFYISNERKTVAFYAPEETERTVVAISFGDDKMVEAVRTYTREDGKDVLISEKTTPTAGHDLNFIKDMLGNIGRFSEEE